MAPRRVSCGCCAGPVSDRCCCRNHMDLSVGLRPRVCAAHSETGAAYVVAVSLLLLAVSASAQQRTVYTDATADGRRGGPVRAVVEHGAPRPTPSPEMLAALKAREYVEPPEWPDGPTAVSTTWRPWMDRPGDGRRLFQRTDLLGTLPGISFTYGPPYGGGLYGHRNIPPMYGPLIVNGGSGRVVHSGGRSGRR